MTYGAWERAHPEKMREYRQKSAAKNPAARKASRLKWVKANPEKVAAIRRRFNQSPKGRELMRRHDCSPQRRATRHGMTLTFYMELRAKQNACCAICGDTLSGGRNEHIDHDKACCPGLRSCGKCVRGILCKGCNTALGVFSDSPEILRRAAAYVENQRDRWRL